MEAGRRKDYGTPKPESLDDAGAACSECGDRRSYVTITAEDIRCVDRIRTCLDCGHVWDTVEFPESDLTQDGPRCSEDTGLTTPGQLLSNYLKMVLV